MLIGSLFPSPSHGADGVSRIWDFFNTALCAKSLWHGLCKTSLWGDIIHAKYLKRLPLSLWLRAGKFHSCNPSLMWKSLCSALPCILDHLRWKVDDGSNITLGLDRMVGVSIWNLSRPLLSSLESRNIIVLKRAWAGSVVDIP